MRMFHPVTCNLLFEFELFYNFDKAYVKAGDFFHYFYAPGGFVGISFADAK